MALSSALPRSLTLLLQEALLRGTVKFDHDSILGSDVAVAIVNSKGDEVLDLRSEWLPRQIYGEEEYVRRINELRRRRYFGKDASDKAGILRYTKVIDSLIDLDDIPYPSDERELAWLLSFCWHVDKSYDSLPELLTHLQEGSPPEDNIQRNLTLKCQNALSHDLKLTDTARRLLEQLKIEN